MLAEEGNRLRTVLPPLRTGLHPLVARAFVIMGGIVSMLLGIALLARIIDQVYLPYWRVA